MSRLSNSLVQLRWGSKTACARLSRGWLRRRPIATAGRAIDGDAAASQSRREQLRELLGELGSARALRGAALQVELSDVHFHFDVAAGDFSGRTHAELGVVARAYAAEILGSSDDIDLRWELQSDERHLVVCGVPRTLLDDIQALSSAHAMKLQCVVPSFQQAWNRHGPRQAAGLSVMANLNASGALIALSRNGTIEALESASWPGPGGKATAPSAKPLDASVDRLLASLGHAPLQVAAFLAAGYGGTLDLHGRWTICTPQEPAR